MQSGTNQNCINNLKINTSLLEYLKNCLNNVSEGLAVKFNLFDGAGRPRKAFIVDSLFRFSCLGCLRKVFTHVRMPNNGVDALYREMHSLAVNLLSGALMHALGNKSLGVYCEDVNDYGRADVVVRSTGFGAVVMAEDASVVVEVKTGKGLSFAQLFRYLLQHPNAVLIVWRVGLRQVFKFKGERLQALLCMYTASAVNRALKLLNGEFTSCEHYPNIWNAKLNGDPQKLLDSYFDGLMESLPKAVAAVVEALKEGGVCGV